VLHALGDEYYERVKETVNGAENANHESEAKALI